MFTGSRGCCDVSRCFSVVSYSLVWTGLVFKCHGKVSQLFTNEFIFSVKNVWAPYAGFNRGKLCSDPLGSLGSDYPQKHKIGSYVPALQLLVPRGSEVQIPISCLTSHEAGRMLYFLMELK